MTGNFILIELQSSRPTNTRGDTLNNPTLTIELESPSDDILLLKSTHWKAQKSVSIGPHYELYPDGIVSTPVLLLTYWILC